MNPEPSLAPSARRRHDVWAAIGWLVVALVGAAAIAVLALVRGETVNAVWFIVAAVACYTLAYRFYAPSSRRASSRSMPRDRLLRSD